MNRATLTSAPKRCTECGFDWSLSAPATVVQIASAPAGYRRLVERWPVSDAAWRSRPAPTVWSGLECLAHTADALDWYRGRITEVLARDGARLEAFDWDAACEERRYCDRDVAATLRDLERACAVLVVQLRGLDAGSWEKAGVGSSDGGPRTVLSLSRRAAHELSHHRGDIGQMSQSSGDGT